MGSDLFWARISVNLRKYRLDFARILGRKYLIQKKWSKKGANKIIVVVVVLEFRSKSEIPFKKPNFSRIREYFLLKIQNNPENIENMNKTWFF